MNKQLTFCLWLLAVSHPLKADFLGVNKDLNEVQSNIKIVREDMDQIKQQKNTIINQLAEIEKRYGESVSSVRNLEAKINQKTQKLDGIRRQIQLTQDQLAVQNKELAGQIRAAYAMGQREKLKLLLNQEDTARSSRMIAYYNYLNVARLKKLKATQESLAKLDALDKQEHEQAALLAIDVNKKKSEQNDLMAVRKQRNELLLQLSSDFTSREQQLSRLKEGENNLRNLIASWNTLNKDDKEKSSPEVATSDAAPVSGTDELQAKESFPQVDGPFSNLKGKLPWPAKGRGVHKFGSNDESSVADGVLITAKEGTEIRAVTGGKVAYAEWLKGYGLLIIIDHGDGYMTLYAFNQSLYKHVGDSVKAGEVIASVGQSGGRNQAGVYFAIRKDGHPVDPFQWVKN